MEKVVLYPSPFIGHIISMVELGKLLLTHSPSLSSITIIIPSSPFNTLHSYSSYLSMVSSSFPSITFIFHPPVPLLHDLSSYDDQEQITYENLRRNNNNVVETLQSLKNSSNISAFILDFFCYSALEVSQSLNIPSYFFFSSAASVLSFFLNLPVIDRTYTGGSYRDVQVMLEIPGLFCFPSSHMIECMLDRGESYREFVNLGEVFLKSNGIIVNTFKSLEVKAVKGLKDGTILPGSRIPPVYCIGPLIANRGGGGGGARHECLSWLDTQPRQSVVYLCFGSEGLFSKEQLWEIAVGLEKSGVRFLWVVRAPPSDETRDSKVDEFLPVLREPDLDMLLPKGFIERTKDRGLVVKLWVPQIDVLQHGAVGAFVTHCGWNSTLEAVYSGVPMVAWPLYAEQKFNKILLVEEIRIALPLDESDDGLVSAYEIEKRVKQIMSSEDGILIRKRVRDLKHEAKIAFDEGCSSKVALSMLIESWK